MKKWLSKSILPIVVLSIILALTTGCASQAINVTTATVNDSGHLVIALSDGTSVDAGYVVGPTGATGPAGPQGPAGVSESISVSDIVSNISPSLVYINVVTPTYEDVGTGIIISNQGYILTCYHVISGAHTITVTLNNGLSTSATVITGSQGRDYAIIKMSNVPNDLHVAELGSSSSAAVGDTVVSAGFALGYTPNPSFSFGIISAFRTLSNYNYIQVDAAINPGDSGGPLLNMAGQVIGINDQEDVYDNNGDPVMNMAYCLPIDEITSQIQTYTGG